MGIIEPRSSFHVRFMVHERKDPDDLFINICDKDVYAYFPFSDEGSGRKTCYSHIGQHSTCTVGYIFNSRVAKIEEYNDLYEEMSKMGFDLRISRNNLLSLTDVIDKKIAIRCNTQEEAHRLLIEIGKANYSEIFKTDRAGLKDSFNVFYSSWDVEKPDTCYSFLSQETTYEDKLSYCNSKWYKNKGYMIVDSKLIIS